MTLEEAERPLCGMICRALRLKPGERLVGVGSGRGGTALPAAERRGVDVANHQLVPGQNAVTAERIRQRRLEGRVTSVGQDRRALLEEKERYEAGGGTNLHEILFTKGKGRWSRESAGQRAARDDAG